ncbi:hypothetical protein [Burkholderia pseudomultivorans]|uniref:hypothetical protein n=1 Tax=Burkholderia pseudomultivorans TaxID=1207504 RepID=UPI0008414D31|nr:hypothetical protein [Burkholderia pseudomultivorans]AOI92783.1 hypothetical protein WS57_29475 [Burkholderia pseudomultivorans]
MSDDIDRFVLAYTVDLRDSIARLEALNEKVSKVGKGSDNLRGKVGHELKGALDDLTNSFGGLEGTLGRVIGRLGAVGGAAGVAAAGVAAAVALAAKGIRDMNAMQDLSYKTGIGTLSMEAIQRNVSKFSNGRVDRDMTKGGMESFGNFWKDAYKNPTGKASLAMLRMGVNVRELGPNAAFGAAADWLHAHQGPEALAIGNQIGWNPNLTNAIAARGKSINSLDSLTTDQINEHSKAQEAANRVNKFVGDLNETLSEWKFEAADKVINFFQTVGHVLGGAMARIGQAQIDSSNAQMAALGIDPNKIATKPKEVTEAEKKKAKEEADTAEKARKTAEKQAEDQDAAAKAQANADGQWQQIIDLFSSSVSKFAAAVDQNQMLAAWAGEIGKANGLPGSSNDIRNAANPGAAARGLRNNNPGNIEYGSFAKSQGAIGSDGRFAIFPSMEQGAAARKTLLDKNYFAKGLDTPRKIINKYAPGNENDVPKYLAYLKSKGFDPDMPVKDRDAFSAAVMAHESGYNSGRGIGESRAKIQRREVQVQLAGALGVPLSQVQRGGVSKGDAQFALQQAQTGVSNHIYQLRKELLNPMLPPLKRGQIQMEIRDQQRGLNLMQQYSGGIEAGQKAGGRMLTEGQIPAISIQNVINGGQQDSKAIAEEVTRQLRKALLDVLNQNANGIKG